MYTLLVYLTHVYIASVKLTRNVLVSYADQQLTISAEILGMAGEDRRPSAILGPNPFIEVTDATDSSLASPTSPQQVERTPSPIDDMITWKHSPKPHRHRVTSETQYADTEVEELLAMLRETESLEEQGDILQYLVREISSSSC